MAWELRFGPVLEYVYGSFFGASRADCGADFGLLVETFWIQKRYKKGSKKRSRKRTLRGKRFWEKLLKDGALTAWKMLKIRRFL